MTLLALVGQDHFTEIGNSLGGAHGSSYECHMRLTTYKCTSIIECIKALPVAPEPEPGPEPEPEPEPDACAGSSIRAGPSITDEPLERALERLHTSGPADLIAAGTTVPDDTESGATGVMFMVCYHIWALCEAHALQVLLAKECSERGVQVSSRLKGHLYGHLSVFSCSALSTSAMWNEQANAPIFHQNGISLLPAA